MLKKFSGARIFLKSPLVCSNLFLVHITNNIVIILIIYIVLGDKACRIFFRHVSLAGIFCLGTVSPPPVISNGPSLITLPTPNL